MSTENYEAETNKWREERAANLRNNERSWFALAGLFWLKEEDNSFGSDPDNDFVLPPFAPKKAGVFHFNNGIVTVTPEAGVSITCRRKRITLRPLRDDQDENPDFLFMRRLIMVVIKRGTATLIRIWDRKHPDRLAFKDLNYYPYKPEYRILADYTGYAPFKVVKQKDIIGEMSDRKMIGFITFEWQGQKYSLDAEDGGDGLFLAFRDGTTAETTYAGGRYLETEKPAEGKVTIDFNRAYNPPCGYVTFATCGLPTPDNRLPIRIEAGEKKYRQDH